MILYLNWQKYSWKEIKDKQKNQKIVKDVNVKEKKDVVKFL